MATESQQLINTENDEISFKELIFKIGEWWRYLLSKWLIILLFGIFGGMLGYFYAASKKPVYTATTTFVLESGESGGRGGLGQYAGLASMAGIDISGGGGIFQGDNLPELYKSRTMIEKTLLSPPYDDKNSLLIDRYIEFNKLKEAWANKPDLLNLTFDSALTTNTRLRDSVMGIIVEDINKNYLKVAKPDKMLSIIQVDVKATDETFAKEFNTGIVENVNSFYLQTKTKKSLANVAILQHKTDSVRSVMNGAIYSAAAISDATPNLNPTRQVQRIAPTQRAQFSAETNKAILGGLVQSLEMTKMGLLKEAPLIQVIDQPVYPLQMEKFGKAKGILLGGIVFGLLTVIFFIIKKVIRQVFAT